MLETLATGAPVLRSRTDAAFPSMFHGEGAIGPPMRFLYLFRIMAGGTVMRSDGLVEQTGRPRLRGAAAHDRGQLYITID